VTPVSHNWDRCTNNWLTLVSNRLFGSKEFFAFTNSRLYGNIIDYLFFKKPRWIKEQYSRLSLWPNWLFLLWDKNVFFLRNSCVTPFSHIFHSDFHWESFRTSKCHHPFDPLIGNSFLHGINGSMHWMK